MQTILLATDLSPAANNAARYAAELAKYFSAKLIFVNAFKISGSKELSSLDRYVAAEKNNEAKLYPLERAIQHECKHALKMECYSAIGEPMDVIEKAVNKFKAELVILGITGHASLLKEHWIGSTALRAARELKVNTFVVPENVPFHKIKKLTFACDFENTEKSTLVYVAKYLATAFGANLHVMNVAGKQVKTGKLRSWQFVDKELATVGHDVEFVEDSKPAHSIGQHVNSGAADALIVSPKRRGFFYSLFHSSVTRELIFHTTVPLLVIH